MFMLARKRILILKYSNHGSSAAGGAATEDVMSEGVPRPSDEARPPPAACVLT